MATRAYIRTDPGLFMRKAVEQRYPPGAYAAYDAVRCLAEEQPVRGRFRSEGVWHMLTDDGRDGSDVCAWIGQQSWSNGRIGMIELYPTGYDLIHGPIGTTIIGWLTARGQISLEIPATSGLRAG